MRLAVLVSVPIPMRLNITLRDQLVALA